MLSARLEPQRHLVKMHTSVILAFGLSRPWPSTSDPENLLRDVHSHDEYFLPSFN